MSFTYISLGPFTNGFRRSYNITFASAPRGVASLGFDLDFDLAEKHGATHVTMAALCYHLDFLNGHDERMLTLDQGRAFIALGLVSQNSAMSFAHAVQP